MAKPGATEKVLTEIQRWNRADTTRWDQRNQRFQRDQSLYRLEKPEGLTVRHERDLTVLNDPMVLVRKTSSLIARHPNVIEVPPAPGVDPIVAQKIENLLYLIDQDINQQWMLGLHHPYRYDQAFFALLRGWIVERTMFNPDGEDELSRRPAALWDHQIFDPAHIFPFAVGTEMRRVTHAYTASYAELRDDPHWGERVAKAEAWKDANDDQIVNVRATYWQAEGSWWHAVVGGAGNHSDTQGGADWIKPPTELGYNPWTIVLCKGAAYRGCDWDDQEYLKEVGTGILHEIADTQKQLNRTVTRLNELLSLESNPPITVYTIDGQVKRVSFEPGTRNYLNLKEKMEAHRIGPSIGDYQLLWDIYQQRQARATLPPQFYSEGVDGVAGSLSAATLLAAGRDVLYPFVEGVNQADALKYRKILELYRDFGPTTPLRTKLDQTPLIPGMPGSAGGIMQTLSMGAVVSAEITPQEIHEQGTYVEITRDDMTPQEMATRANIGMAAARDKILSLDTVRQEYFKARNPGRENLKILAESVYLSPGVIQALTPVALSGTGQEYLRKVWEVTQNPMPPAGPDGAPMPAADPNAAGVPGLPPGGNDMSGLGTETLPPILAGNPLANTQVASLDPAAAQMNALLALLNGGAQGGMGAGGLPPIPGRTSPTLLAPPPGRFL